MGEHFERLTFTGLSYREKIGDPDTLSSAVGILVLNFAELEATVDAAIRRLLAADRGTASILTSEISFKAKMHVLSSLTQREILECQQTFYHDDPVSALNELVRMCFQCEEHRNSVLHSFWPGKELRADEGFRVKFTAKARRGLHKTEERMTSGQLLDIADYMAYASTCIEQFYGLPFCGADDLMNGGGEHNLP